MKSDRRAYLRAYHLANREREKRHARAYYLAHREHTIARAAQWRAANIEWAREWSRKYQRKVRVNLGDAYIKNLICNATGLPFSEIPASLIPVTRAFVKLKRTKWKKGIYVNRGIKYKLKAARAGYQQPERPATGAV